MLRFEEMAGLVSVRVTRTDSEPTGAEIDAPQPLQLLGELEPADVAKCIGLMPGHIRVETHRPVRASVGVEFVLIEVAADKLSDAAPDLAAFRDVAAKHEPGRRLSLFIYARDGEAVRARMFAPLAGTWEDPATGSASATLRRATAPPFGRKRACDRHKPRRRNGPAKRAQGQGSPRRGRNPRKRGRHLCADLPRLHRDVTSPAKVGWTSRANMATSIPFRLRGFACAGSC